MCELCNGGTIESMHRTTQRLIAAGSWRLMAVDGRCPWTYTIGLSDLGLPELVMLGPPTQASRVLNGLGEQLRGGLQINPGSEVTVKDRQFMIGAVNERHLARGLIDYLVAYREWEDRQEFSLRLLQVRSISTAQHPVQSARRLDGVGNPLRL